MAKPCFALFFGPTLPDRWHSREDWVDFGTIKLFWNKKIRGIYQRGGQTP